MAKNLPQNIGKTYGASGTIIQNGYISGEEYNRKLMGLAALHIYDIMSRSDGDVHGILEVCKQPIVAAAASIIPPKGQDGKIDPDDQDKADQIEYELFQKIDFDDLKYQALDMLDYGFSVFEKVFEVHDFRGKPVIGLNSLQFRKQTTVWLWETQDHKPGVTQQTFSGSYSIPLEKLLVFTNRKRGDNYQGVSLLRYVYKDWLMKDGLTLVNGQALEQLGKGVVKATARDGQTISPQDKTVIQESLRNFQSGDDNFIIEPNTATIEMLDMKGTTTKDIIPTLNYHRRSIFTSIQATFLDMGGSSGSGAHALAKDMTSLFLKSEEYIAKTLAAAINEQLIKQLCDLNFTDMPNGYPKLVFGNLADDDLASLATAMNALTTAGLVTPDAEMENKLRQLAGMPQMPEQLQKNYLELQTAKHTATLQSLQPGDGDGADNEAGKEGKTDPKDSKDAKLLKKASVLADARKTNAKLIDIILRD